MSNVRNIHFEAVGSYLRPAELKEARAKCADGKISATDLRPHRHGILQSRSARYAKGRWVALARILASVANKVYVNPEGNVDWHGIASQPQYIN